MAGSAECAIRTEVEVPILALATMVDGLRKSHLPALPSDASKVAMACDFMACAQVAGCSLAGVDPTLARLEPDLLGEFFVLATLEPPDPFKGTPHPWLPETAWRLEDGHRMAEFVGRAAYGAELASGPQRRLVTMIVEPDPDDPADVIGDEPIWHDGTVVGWVTSGGYAHHSRCSIVLGYVPTALAAWNW